MSHKPSNPPHPSSLYKGEKRDPFFCDNTCPTLEHTKRYPQHPGGFCTNGNSFFTSILSPQGCKLLHLTICNGHPFLLSAKREKKSRGSGGKGKPIIQRHRSFAYKEPILINLPRRLAHKTQHTEKEFRDPK